MKTIEFISHSEKETLTFTKTFVKTLKIPALIAFYGNLGAGKTVLTRGICKNLGFKGIVNSPTYTIVHEYPNNPPIFHLDLYRLENGSDLEDIGFSRILEENAVTLIEWAERLENQNNLTHLIFIEILSETERKIKIRYLKE